MLCNYCSDSLSDDFTFPTRHISCNVFHVWSTISCICLLKSRGLYECNLSVKCNAWSKWSYVAIDLLDIAKSRPQLQHCVIHQAYITNYSFLKVSFLLQYTARPVWYISFLRLLCSVAIFTPRMIFRNGPTFAYGCQPKLRSGGLSYRTMLITSIPILSKGWAGLLAALRPFFRTGFYGFSQLSWMFWNCRFWKSKL